MLVMSPESTCDICLEPFTLGGESRAPHAPRCGHVFCLKCLKSSICRVCPICGSPFIPSEFMRIHPRSSFTASSQEINSQAPSDSSIKLARELHDCINSFIHTGGNTFVARTLTEDCKIFFQENSRADHQDFYVTYQLFRLFLLSYYRALFPAPAVVGKSLEKIQVDVQAYQEFWETKCRTLTQKNDNLTETLRLERQTAEVAAKCLKDQLRMQEKWWNRKYEELRMKYAALQPNFSGFYSTGAIHRNAPSDPPLPVGLVRQEMVDHSAYEEQERLTKEKQEEERLRVRKVLREIRDRGGVLV